MRVLVCVKRVPATAGKITLTADEQAIDTRYLGFTVSPHEECAVEEAVRIVEAHGGTSTVLTLGSEESIDQLREAMAVGIDGAILLETDGSEWDGQATAGAIVEAIRADESDFDLILFGNESADASGYQVGVRVAHALGRPVVTGIKGLTVADGVARAEKPVAVGREVYEIPLPAVVTVKDGLNIPRYPSVPGRIRAKKKPIERTAPDKPGPRIEKKRFVQPESTGKQTEFLDGGADAAARLVEVFRQIGVI